MRAGVPRNFQILEPLEDAAYAMRVRGVFFAFIELSLELRQAPFGRSSQKTPAPLELRILPCRLRGNQISYQPAQGPQKLRLFR